MLSQTLESFLRGLEASVITEIFLLLILGSLALGLVLEFASRRWVRAARLTAFAPTLLTLLGVLGTFTGIVVGLLDFDPARIDESIGSLLEGLKTAFITSLVGMGASIAFRLSQAALRPAVSGAESGIGPDEILAALNEQTQLLEATRNAIAGSEESSLAGQLKLLRTDMEDGSRRDREAREAFANALWQRLEMFTEVLSRSATEQVIEALKQVIVDFNRNLTEQFGDNFKALDAAVQKLVEWQENYRQQLQQLHEHYSRSVDSIGKIQESMALIDESTESIPRSAEKLATTIETAHHQLTELQRHLDAFQELRDKAVAAIPQVQAHVQEMTNGIAASVQLTNEHHRKVQDDIQAVQRQVGSAIEQSAEGLLEQMRQSVSRTQDGVNAQLEALDQAMQQELNRVMNEMGRALGQIAGKFADDYQELTEAMGRIVHQQAGGRR